jgi:hypothetical protein
MTNKTGLHSAWISPDGGEFIVNNYMHDNAAKILIKKRIICLKNMENITKRHSRYNLTPGRYLELHGWIRLCGWKFYFIPDMIDIRITKKQLDFIIKYMLDHNLPIVKFNEIEKNMEYFMNLK